MRTLFIDSRDRTPTSKSPTDFTIELKSTLSLLPSQRLRVSDLRVPQCVPTIREGINDTIVVASLVGSVSHIIPAGNYDGPGLAAGWIVMAGAATAAYALAPGMRVSTRAGALGETGFTVSGTREARA
jgi:hypothetical protein